MDRSIKNFWREPLLHFLLIGIALFAFYDLTAEQDNETPNLIVRNSGQIEQLTANFKRTWMRSPTQNEVDALVDNFIREEVFYREALAMGLDQNDPIVKRRMRMKLEFILEDLSSQNISDNDLIKYLQDNPDKFKTQSEISFQQVYFNPEKRKNMSADLEKSLLLLHNDTDPETLGDPILIPFDNPLATQNKVALTYGEDFAKKVINLNQGEWIGPVYSEFGAHIVKIQHRKDGIQPTLSDIRALVEREYLAEKRKKQKDMAYKQLRKGYEARLHAV